MPTPKDPIDRINKLYSNCLTLLEAEVKHFRNISATGKLPDTAARALVHYIKLLSEMKRAHAVITAEAAAKAKEDVRAVGDEELLRAATSGPLQSSGQPWPRINLNDQRDPDERD